MSRACLQISFWIRKYQLAFLILDLGLYIFYCIRGLDLWVLKRKHWYHSKKLESSPGTEPVGAEAYLGDPRTAWPGHTCSRPPTGAPPSNRATPTPAAATLSERLEVTRSDFRHRKRALGKQPSLQGQILEARLTNALYGGKQRACRNPPQALPPSGRGFSPAWPVPREWWSSPSGSSRKSASWRRFHLRVRKRRRQMRPGDTEGAMASYGPERGRMHALTADGGSERKAPLWSTSFPGAPGGPAS